MRETKVSKIKVDRRLLKTMRNFQESSQQLSRRLQYLNPRYQSQESKIIQDINDDRFSLKRGRMLEHNFSEMSYLDLNGTLYVIYL